MIKKLTFSLLAVIFCMTSAFAVTRDEMEQARATTALWYLRYVNDGSDYLEKLSPKTVAELQTKLRDKEKENIKIFLTVEVPSDYPSWDKDKLVEYWSKTIFSNPKFPEKAQAAKRRIKSKLQAMQIAAPTQTPTEQTQVPETPSADTAQTQIVTETTDDIQTTVQDSATTTEATVDEEFADEENKSGSSMTWLYIAILIVLVGVVIWLVVYATNSIKKTTASNGTAPDKAALNKYISELEKKDKEIAELKEKLQAMSIRLRSAEAKAAPKQPTAQYTNRKISPQNPRTIYLAQANTQGVFVRADAEYNMGNSIFKLVTTDGVSGSFSVIEDSNVYELALMMPVDFLINACVGKNLQIAQGMKTIVTDNAGTAIFENGKWRVIRKAEIHYEK